MTSGVKELDAATCAYILKSWRFKPATDDQGRAVFASFIQYFKWVNPNSWAIPPTEHRSSDTVLTVNKLSAGGVSGATVYQIREVDGRASACYPANDTVNKMLAKVACDYLSKVDVSDLTDNAGTKVRGVYEWRVNFTTSDAASPGGL